MTRNTTNPSSALVVHGLVDALRLEVAPSLHDRDGMLRSLVTSRLWTHKTSTCVGVRGDLRFAHQAVEIGGDTIRGDNY